MKFTLFVVAVLTAAPSVTCFAPCPTLSVARTTTATSSSSCRHMFGGGGELSAMEDNPEAQKAMAEAAKAMGMSLEEYKLGMNARLKFEKSIGDMRFKAGNDDIGVEVDGKAPPTHLVVTISQNGKGKGADTVAKELTAAFKQASGEAKKGRATAQQDMMKYIQEQMK